MLQEALIESWRRGGRCGPADDSLVYTTIRRRAVDLARRDDRRVRREQAAPDGWFEPAPAAEMDAELARAVETLPDNLREVVVMKTWGDLTFQQIADSLGVPLNTAASRYRYGLERLREVFQEPGHERRTLEARLRGLRPAACRSICAAGCAWPIPSRRRARSCGCRSWRHWARSRPCWRRRHLFPRLIRRQKSSRNPAAGFRSADLYSDVASHHPGAGRGGRSH